VAVRWKNQLKRKLFGLDSAKTLSYLRGLRALQEQEVALLKEDIRSQQSTNEKLRLEVSLLEAKCKERLKQNKLYELAEKRLEDSKRVLQVLGDVEVKTVHDLIDQKRSDHEQQIKQLEAQSQSYEQTLHSLMDELSALIGKIEQLDVEKEDPEIHMQQDTSSAEVAATKVQSVLMEEILEELTATEEPAAPSEDKELASLQKRAKLIQFKLRSIADQQSDDLIQKSAMEAKGRVQEDTEHTESGVQATGTWGPHASVNRAAPQPPGVRKKPVSKPSAFWGDVDDYIGSNYLEAIEETQSLPIERSATLSDTTGAFEAAAPEAKNTPTESKPNAETGGQAKESPALSEEIHAIRNRYIVGKLAGEALYNQQGMLIIAKNETITAEIVDRANREGKLPDLIVNMIIPNLNDGSEG
jgi:hypothetical protein